MNCTLVEKLTSRDGYQLAPIQSLHMLLMTKVYVDVDSSSFKSSRAIEENIWNKYVEEISGKKPPKDIIAYHAKSSSEDVASGIGSWEFFARMKAGKFSIQDIIPYILLLAIFSISFNVLTDIVLYFLPELFPAINLIWKKILVVVLGAVIIWIALRQQGKK
jgi:hypothetical protein